MCKQRCFNGTANREQYLTHVRWPVGQKIHENDLVGVTNLHALEQPVENAGMTRDPFPEARKKTKTTSKKNSSSSKKYRE